MCTIHLGTIFDSRLIFIWLFYVVWLELFILSKNFSIVTVSASDVSILSSLTQQLWNVLIYLSRSLPISLFVCQFNFLISIPFPYPHWCLAVHYHSVFNGDYGMTTVQEASKTKPYLKKQSIVENNNMETFPNSAPMWCLHLSPLTGK